VRTLLGLVLLPLIVGCSETSTGHRTSATPSAAPGIATPSGSSGLSDVVPVIECPTSRGVSGRPGAYYPETIALTIAPTVATQLAYYSDDVRSLTPILAPRGWACRVQVGADGSTSVNVYPGSSLGRDNAVTAQSNGGCVGCASDLACGLIPTAPKLLGYSNIPCPAPRNRAERINWITGSEHPTGQTVNDVVGFEDPPGIRGNGDPSGGRNPANGVLLFATSPGSDTSASLETCALPESDHRLCTTILNDFVNQDWPHR
jgi:hypothetical protein